MGRLVGRNLRVALMLRDLPPPASTLYAGRLSFRLAHDESDEALASTVAGYGMLFTATSVAEV